MPRRTKREYACRVIVDDHDEVTVVVETPSLRMARLDLNESKALDWARRVLRKAVRESW